MCNTPGAVFEAYLKEIQQLLVTINRFRMDYNYPVPEVPQRLRSLMVDLTPDGCSCLHTYLLIGTGLLSVHMYLVTTDEPEPDRLSDGRNPDILIGWSAGSEMRLDKRCNERGLQQIQRYLNNRPRLARKVLSYLEQLSDWLRRRVAGLERHHEHVWQQVTGSRWYTRLYRKHVLIELGCS
ncbi:MAG: hypothetical protein KatS3mg023_3653 [Armatimonadota bacterium]|nr:MAG: hypothetical protein KatS3mg023_3653 [Armatimonadota bacterium]